MKRLSIVLLMIFTLSGTAFHFSYHVSAQAPEQGLSQEELSLEEGFDAPPLSARTRGFWWWLNGNVTKESITNDLEEMQAKGMGGGLIFDADGASQRGNAPVPAGPMFGTPEWRELFVHAVEEADRLGLELGLSIQSGWNLGAPDLTPDETAKQLVWSELLVDSDEAGASSISLDTPAHRDGYYRDIAVLAFRVDEPSSQDVGGTDDEKPAYVLSAESQGEHPITLAVDGNLDTYWVSNGFKPGDGPSAEQPVVIEARFPEPVTISGARFLGRQNYGPKLCELLIGVADEDDGQAFNSIAVFPVEDGEGAEWRVETPIETNILRLEISDAYDTLIGDQPRNVQIAELTLFDAAGRPFHPVGGTTIQVRPPIRDLQKKAMFHELGGSVPDCRHLLFDVAATPGEEDTTPDEIVTLTDRLRDDGTLDWDVPEGRWTILRFGFTTTGAHVSTSSGDWQGPVLDYMSEAAFRAYWSRHVAPQLDAVRPYLGGALRYLETDSWECGGMNWTAGFEQEFVERRGYNPLPFLPVFAGKIVGDRASSNAFLADFRKTLGDCVSDRHYRIFAELARENKLETQPESGGPHAGPLDALNNYQHNGLLMSEFWRPSPHRPNPDNRFFVKQAASAAHIYGRPLVAAEGFTSIGPHWDDSFWRHLKPSFDHEACDGLNLTFTHTFTCSPPEMGLPGQEYFAGTHFNPQTTWWPVVDGFVGYMNRCHFMLQQGEFVADVAYYYGDHVPNLSGRKHADPAGILPGFDFDVINEDRLLAMTVSEDGQLHLPSGMTYRVLVLPDHKTLSLAALRKVEELFNAGATIVGDRPEHLISMVGGAEAVEEFESIAARLWDDEVPYSRQRIRPSSKAHSTVFRSRHFTDFRCKLTNRDQELPLEHPQIESETLNYIHRRTKDADIYFVVNPMEEEVNSLCGFRVMGNAPEIWDPIDGSRRAVPAFYQYDTATLIPLRFGPLQSRFIVFQRHGDLPQEYSGSDEQIQAGLEQNDPTPVVLRELPPAWDVAFDPAWGGPESIRFETLIDWTEHPEPGIRFYSGSATYSSTFTMEAGELDAASEGSESDRRILLDLGDVYEMAAVRINGVETRVVWAPPFQVDITDAIHVGENTIELDVYNTWRNRLVGDRDLPPEQRRTRTNITVGQDWTPLPSGLLGPVQLMSVER